MMQITPRMTTKIQMMEFIKRYKNKMILVIKSGYTLGVSQLLHYYCFYLSSPSVIFKIRYIESSEQGWDITHHTYLF